MYPIGARPLSFRQREQLQISRHLKHLMLQNKANSIWRHYKNLLECIALSGTMPGVLLGPWREFDIV